MQDIYDSLKSTNPLMGQEEGTVSNDSGLTTWYKDKTLEEWALTAPKYTDPATGLSWYVIDGKQPYMTGEDTEKFWEMCKETGEYPESYVFLRAVMLYIFLHRYTDKHRGSSMKGENHEIADDPKASIYSAV